MYLELFFYIFFFSSRRRHTRSLCDWSSDVCSSDLVVGSGVHGIAIEGTDDHDEMGVFVEPRENIYGLAPALDHHIWRTQPEGARSGPGDTDLVMYSLRKYSLRKYLRLAIKGNPTALLPLFA